MASIRRTARRQYRDDLADRVMDSVRPTGVIERWFEEDPTRRRLERRTQEGKMKKEIIRCLKPSYANCIGHFKPT